MIGKVPDMEHIETLGHDDLAGRDTRYVSAKSLCGLLFRIGQSHLSVFVYR